MEENKKEELNGKKENKKGNKTKKKLHVRGGLTRIIAAILAIILLLASCATLIYYIALYANV